jgi:carbon storage regulator
MLVMKRRQGEAILIGDDIEIHLAHIGRTRVKIGIVAPRRLAVVAKEVQLVRDENRAAAQCGRAPDFSSIISRMRRSSSQSSPIRSDEEFES